MKRTDPNISRATEMVGDRTHLKTLIIKQKKLRISNLLKNR